MASSTHIPSVIAPRIEHKETVKLTTTKEANMEVVERSDPYYWMKDKKDAKLVQYLESENEYQEREMSHTKELQDTLYKEIVGRMNEDDVSAPYPYGNYEYYYRNEKGKQYPIYCRRACENGQVVGEEEIYLDLNEIYDKNKLSFLSLGAAKVSSDHRILAFAIDTTGGEIYSCYFKDLTTGKLLNDRIDRMGGGFQWANDNGNTGFYTVLDHTLRPYKVYRKKLNIESLSDEDPMILKLPSPQDNELVGNEEIADDLMFTDEDERFWVSIGKSLSQQYLTISSGSKITSEIWFLDANTPNGDFACVKPRATGLEYELAHNGSYFYIWENGNGCRNFRLVRVPAGTSDLSTFQDAEEVFPYNDDRFIDYLVSFKDHIAVFVREEGLQKIMILDAKNPSQYYYISFPDQAYNVSESNNREHDSHMLRLTYSSFITPDTTFDYDMINKKFIVKKEKQVKGFDKNLYEVKRINIAARDGIQVPMSMVYRKRDLDGGETLKKDGSNPLYLYGYGSYGYALDCYWMDSAISLLDRGIIFVIAHIRGGGENGRYWRDEGKLQKKKNTFNDFVDCAKCLIQEGYTSPDKLCISGGSAGGLLVGACINMNPELFAAAILRVPFVDCVNTMLDATIPLTVAEYEEWGNPNEKEVYDYMMQYSPYDNIESPENVEKPYPAIMLTQAFNDARVQVWEGAKYVARMRHYYSTMRQREEQGSKILMKTEMSSGHGGVSGRYKRVHETSHLYAFVIDQIVSK